MAEKNYANEKEIFQGLASLNDLVRLSALLDEDFPFADYKEVDKLPVIEVEFSHLAGIDNSQGTLVLLDTPGPNEAGQPHLKTMMRDQLRKASAVLAVLDYTQLSSDADQQVRTELNNIAEIAKDRLFVLVNKFDQKDRNSDKAETVKKSVPAMLNNGVLDADRVYPVSSRQAFLANCARNIVNRGDQLSIDEPWVEDFAKLGFGEYDWEENITQRDLVKNVADKIWQKSLFDKLITEVIQAAHKKAVALALDSAVTKLAVSANEVKEYLSTRYQGLSVDKEKLKTQIDGLLADLEDVKRCQQTVSDNLEVAMASIDYETNTLLENAREEVSKSLDKYFKEGKSEEKKRTGTGKRGRRKSDRDFDPDERQVKFEEKRDAQKFIQKIEETVTNLLAQTEEDIKPKLTKIVQGMEQFLRDTDIKSISQKINARLKDDGFTVNIRFPDVDRLRMNFSVGVRMEKLLEEKTYTKTGYRRQSGVWGTICSWFGTDDWGWEEYDYDVTYKIVNIDKIQQTVDQQTEQHFENLREAIEKSIRQPILQETEIFFDNFKEKVDQLRNTLNQSLDDQKKDQKEKEQLTQRLKSLLGQSNDMSKDSEALKKDVESLSK